MLGGHIIASSGSAPYRKAHCTARTSKQPGLAGRRGVSAPASSSAGFTCQLSRHQTRPRAGAALGRSAVVCKVPTASAVGRVELGRRRRCAAALGALNSPPAHLHSGGGSRAQRLVGQVEGAIWARGAWAPVRGHCAARVQQLRSHASPPGSAQPLGRSATRPPTSDRAKALLRAPRPLFANPHASNCIRSHMHRSSGM